MLYQRTPDYELLTKGDMQYSIVNRKTPAGRKYTPEIHIHNCYEVYVNISGNVTFFVNNSLYPIKAGDIIFTCPGETHFCINNGTDIHEHFCLWLTAMDQSPFVSFSHEEKFCNLISMEDASQKTFIQLLYKLLEMEETKSPVLLRTAKLCEIFEMMRMQCLVENNSAENLIPEELLQILTYINDHFQEIQIMKDICDKFYLSPATLNRWFHKYLEITPGIFLESKKLAYARQLLIKGYTVQQTCKEVGFSDSSYFISLFKKTFGETPKQHIQNSD